MNALATLLAITLLASSVAGHAVLRQPPAWNSNPSKTSPCGGGTATDVVATYQVGSTVTITWQVVAGDGAGQLSAAVDLNGGTNFATTLTVGGSGAAPTSVGTYQATITMPGTTSAKATLQVKSSSGWYSCATIKLQTGAVSAQDSPAHSTTCVTLSGLTFCSDLNGKSVKGFIGNKDPKEVDTELKSTHDSYLGNPLVYKPLMDTCSETYRKFLCAQTFVPCTASDSATACAGTCDDVGFQCGVQPEHTTLYNCDLFQADGTSDIYAVCSGNGAGALTVSYAVLLLALLAAIAHAAF